MRSITRKDHALAGLLALFATAPTATAQVVSLVEDFYPPGNSNPRDIIAYGDSIFLITDEPGYPTGVEQNVSLVTFDPVRDHFIARGTGIEELTLVGDRLFWAEDDVFFGGKSSTRTTSRPTTETASAP